MDQRFLPSTTEPRRHGVTGVLASCEESTLSGLTPASTPMTGAGAEDLWSDEAGPKFFLHRIAVFGGSNRCFFFGD